MDIIQRNSLRINNIITELLNLAKPSELILLEHSLQEIMDETLSRANDRIKLQNIHVKKHYPPNPIILKADKEKLVIALLNISMTESDDGYDVCIKDSGKGFSKEYLSRLFEPFFTMKKNGMGLGLTVTYSILQSHNAKIRAHSKENEGTEFQISFKK
jgi:signal transduction histidine kinase